MEVWLFQLLVRRTRESGERALKPSGRIPDALVMTKAPAGGSEPAEINVRSSLSFRLTARRPSHGSYAHFSLSIATPYGPYRLPSHGVQLACIRRPTR